MLKQPLNTANHLPDDVQALFFLCDCFGLGENQLTEWIFQNRNLIVTIFRLKKFSTS